MKEQIHKQLKSKGEKMAINGWWRWVKWQHVAT
jgi:hypothetical protein